MNNEDFEVDLEGMHKQYKDDVLNNGNFMRCSVLIESVTDIDKLKETYPMCEVECKSCSPITVALMAMTLDKLKENILDEYDAHDEYQMLQFAHKGTRTVRLDGGEKDND